MADVSVPSLFAAGVVSFLSPCVLPIVPGYISYMSGFAEADAGSKRSVPAWAVSLAFVAGFTVVFVALGATASLLGSVLRENQRVLAQVGGVFIIFLGLIFMGVLKVPFFYREARFHPRPGAGIWGSVLLGSAFAFGWSPCIGPTLALALGVAAGRGGDPREGALLLLVYSLGLGLPFIAAGLGVTRLTGAVAALQRRMRVINVVSGVLLVGVGVLLASGQFFQLSIWFQKTFPASF